MAAWKDGSARRVAVGYDIYRSSWPLSASFPIFIRNCLLAASERDNPTRGVAAGTSVPELATTLAAARRGRTAMAAGNLIGSDIFNVLGVLGLAALIHPLAVQREALLGVGMMLVAMTLLLVFLRSGWHLTRLEGAILIVVSLARWGGDIWGGRGP